MADSQRDEITKLETLYASNPDGRVFTHLAEAYRKAGDLGKARDILDQGLRRHPDYASAHVVLGRVLADQGNPAQAADAFTRVLQLDPDNLIARRSLAESDRAAGRTAEALHHYRELLTHDPSDEDVQAAVAELEARVAPPPLAEPPAETTTRAEEEWDTAPAFSMAPIDLGTIDAGRQAADEPLSLDSISFSTEPQDEAATGMADFGAGSFDTFDSFAAPSQPTEPGGDAGDLDTSGFGSFDAFRPSEPDHPADLSLSDLGYDAEEAAEGVEAEAEELFAEPAPAPEREPEPERLEAESAPPSGDMPAWAALGAWGVEGDRPAAEEPIAPAEEPVAPAEEPVAPAEEPVAPAEEPVAPAEEPVARAHAEPGGAEVPAAAGSVATETLAELYRGQGFPDRAVGVYRELLRHRPDDPVLRERLRETEAEAQAVRSGQIGVEETREFWVSGPGAAAAGSGHTWGVPDDEDVEEGPSISQYLSGLLSFRPAVAGALPAAQDEPAVQPEPEPQAGIAEPLAEIAAPTTEYGQTVAGSEEYLAETVMAEPVPDGPAVAPPVMEPVLDDAAAELFLTEADASEERAIAEAEDVFLSAAPEVEAGEAGVADGWDPTVELAGDIEPEPEPGAAAGAAGMGLDDEGDEEDDDLEMFRSWLQSLKK